ncbi:MAG TPA: lipopolysaccharide N-acetylglucosaminyl transferase [Burkholderiaceae bacterium]|nr:lipopolysaccharide N-acetylglucosaminyl transferase [Burkholderiaceae bacterium]
MKRVADPGSALAAALAADARPRRGASGRVALAAGLLATVAIDAAAVAHAALLADTARALAIDAAVHAGASLVLAALLWRTLPASLRTPPRASIAALVSLNLFVPTLAAWMRAAVWLGHHVARASDDAPIGRVEAPEFTSTRERDPTGVRAGQIRAQLTSGEAPPSARLSALLSIQDAPARITSDILRQLLTDPFEDIRLLAYGMLDKKEKAVSQRILAEQATLAQAESGEDGADATTRAERLHGAHKRLAELQWELVYQKLVQGDLLRFTAREAWRHAHEALAVRADDAGLWYLVGRLGLEADEPEAGRDALERAARLGFPRERLVPWLAEYAFRERRYDEVRALFGALATPPDALRVAAAYAYWKF